MKALPGPAPSAPAAKGVRAAPGGPGVRSLAFPVAAFVLFGVSAVLLHQVAYALCLLGATILLLAVVRYALDRESRREQRRIHESARTEAYRAWAANLPPSTSHQPVTVTRVWVTPEPRQLTAEPAEPVIPADVRQAPAESPAPVR